MVIEKSISDALGFLMTVGGIVLSIVALVLSILFYRWADGQAKASDRSVLELRAATDGLGQLVSSLRDESFSLIKSAYTDMGELAKFGVQRDSARPTLIELGENIPEVPSGAQSDGHLDSSVDLATSKTTAPKRSVVTSDVTDEELQEHAVRLGTHMMSRRGSGFHRAFEEAQRLVSNAIADLPSGQELSTEEIAAKLKPYGFDMDEVAYVLVVMTEMGRAEDD